VARESRRALPLLAIRGTHVDSDYVCHCGEGRQSGTDLCVEAGVLDLLRLWRKQAVRTTAPSMLASSKGNLEHSEMSSYMATTPEPKNSAERRRVDCSLDPSEPVCYPFEVPSHKALTVDTCIASLVTHWVVKIHSCRGLQIHLPI
jgi:hypothetical protein